MLSTDPNSFEETRCKLLLKTAGFRKIKKHLKKKHRLGRLSPFKLKDKFAFNDFTGSALGNDIKTISLELNLNLELTEDLLSGWIETKGFGFTSLPVYVVPTDEPFPEGFYIKVDAYTSKKTINEAHKKIQFMWEELEKTKDSGPSIKIKKREQSPNLSTKLPIFNLIEETMYTKLIDQDDGINGIDPESFESIVNDSIKLSTESILGKEDLLRGKEIYYSIVDYYHIPTFTTFKELLVKLS